MIFYRKGIILFLICCICFGSESTRVVDDQEQINVTEVIEFEDESCAEATSFVKEFTCRSSPESFSKTYIYKDLTGNKIFTYTLCASFQYIGNSLKATGCSTTWTKKWDNYYCSGNKAYAIVKFSDSNISKTVRLKITCDEDGKIS